MSKHPTCRYDSKRAAIITHIGAYCADCANTRLRDDLDAEVTA